MTSYYGQNILMSENNRKQNPDVCYTIDIRT